MCRFMSLRSLHRMLECVKEENDNEDRSGDGSTSSDDIVIY